MSRPLHGLSTALISLSLVIALGGTACAGTTPADSLKVGDPAPDFVIPSTVSVPEGSGTVSIRAITATGRSVVLAFFPKAFTGG